MFQKRARYMCLCVKLPWKETDMCRCDVSSYDPKMNGEIILILKLLVEKMWNVYTVHKTSQVYSHLECGVFSKETQQNKTKLN